MGKIFFLGSCQFASYCLAYGFTWFLTRYYNPKTVGTFFIAYSICFGLCALIRWGWGQAVLRYCAMLLNNTYESSRSFFIHALRRIALRGILVIAALILFVRPIQHFYGGHEIGIALYALAIFTLFQPFSEIMIQYMRVLGRIRLFAILQYLVPPVTKLALVALMTFLASRSIFIITASVSIAQFSSFILGFLILGLCFSITKHNRPFDRTILKEDVLQYVNHIGINLLLIFVLLRGDVLLGSIWLLKEEIAGYQVAKQLSNIILLSLVAFEPFVSPAIAQLFGISDKKSIQRGYHLSIYFLGILTFAPALILIIHGKYILGLFGEYYGQSILLLQILAISQLVNVFSGQSGYILSMAGHSKYVLNNSIAAVLFTFLLIVLFTPFMGAIGLAIAVGAGITMLNIIRTMQINKLENIIWLDKRTMARLTIWLLIAFLMILPLSANTISWKQIMGYLIIYYAILAIFHLVIDKKHLNAFVGIMLPRRLIV